VNLGEAKHRYQQAIAECEEALVAGTGSVEACRTAALRQIEAVTKSARRAIDEQTARWFQPVNTRRGLVTKLERLHRAALDEVDRLTS
jgi:hypothetical protein